MLDTLFCKFHFSLTYQISRCPTFLSRQINGEAIFKLMIIGKHK